MATFSGVIGVGSGYEVMLPASPPVGVEPYLELPVDLSLIPAAEGSSPGYGSVSIPAPVPSPESFSGVKGLSCQRNFFYDVVHMYAKDGGGNAIAADFPLGAISSDALLHVYLWNAYLGEVYVTMVDTFDSIGIENDFPLFPDPPFYVGIFEEVAWDFLVRKEVGPSTFNSVQTLYVSPPPYLENVLLPVGIQGSRSQMWAFAHNWVNACTETLEWLTAINVAHDGTEHRAAMRRIARRYIDTTLYLTRDSARKLDHLLFARQPDYFATPIHCLATKLTIPMNPGDTWVPCETEGRGFIPGSSVMLIDPLTSEGDTLTISWVDPTGIFLVAGPVKAYPKGAMLYPAGSARIVGDIPLVWETKDFATGTVRMEFQPTFTPAYTPHASEYSVEMYAPSLGSASDQWDAEVMNHEPDWAGGLQKNFSYESGVTDSQTGVLSTYKTRERPARTTTHNWLLRTPLEVEDFRKFLFRRRGRASPFWAPSWTNDLRSVEDELYSEGDNQFTFHDNGFFSYSLQEDYINDPAHAERNHLQVELKNGRKFRGRIVAVDSVDQETTRIIFDRNYEFTFKARDINRVSWLNLYRLADDSVTFEWLTPGIARVSLPMVTVPDFLSDTGYSTGGIG